MDPLIVDLLCGLGIAFFLMLVWSLCRMSASSERKYERMKRWNAERRAK